MPLVFKEIEVHGQKHGRSETLTGQMQKPYWILWYYFGDPGFSSLSILSKSKKSRYFKVFSEMLINYLYYLHLHIHTFTFTVSFTFLFIKNFPQEFFHFHFHFHFHFLFSFLYRYVYHLVLRYIFFCLMVIWAPTRLWVFWVNCWISGFLLRVDTSTCNSPM